MKVFFKLIIIMLVAVSFCVYAKANNKTRIIIAPLSVPTTQAGYTIYPNIQELFATDITNNLTKNIRFEIIDFHSAENMLMKAGIYSEYRDFLKEYKDNRVINYNTCGLLSERASIDKMILVSSGFNLQNMVLKEPLLSRLGINEVDPVKSYYNLNTTVSILDTNRCIINYEKTFSKDIEANSFDVPSRSFGENVVSLPKIKEFSENVASETSFEVMKRTNRSRYTKIKKNTYSTTNVKNSRDGAETRDGHSYSTHKNQLKNKRKESYQNWIKERTGFY